MKDLVVASLFMAAVCSLAASSDGMAQSSFKPDRFPAVEALPDPFLFLDGSRVQTKEDWARRREEILELVLNIQYGHLPEAPGNVKQKRIFSKQILHDGVTRLEKHILTMGPKNRIRAQLDLYFPANSDKPCPVILNIGRNSPIIKEINERGYIFAGFGPERFDRSEEGRPTPGAVEQAYPDMEIATLAAWAWGASRMLDYLETLPEVDASKVIITGHSRSGKAALLAGAVDERFALVNPNGSGCGGAGLYRILGPDCEDLEAITRPERWQEWFHKDFRDYAGKEAHLPFDQHFMRALIAPRPVLSTDGTDDTWANPIGTQANYLAAQPVYDFLGVPERNAIHFRSGGHDHDAVDYLALLDFADWQFFGKEATIEFNQVPFPVAEAVDYFSDNGFSNPIATMQHPCAEHYNGTTYIAYSGPHEDPYVCAYTHASGRWFGPVRAGENLMGKTPDPVEKKEVDDHGRPALIVDGKGYIHLVFGGHGGHWEYGNNTLGKPGKGKQTHVVSKRPEDISAWEVLDNISPFGTYSQFVKMEDGDIYLFYRHGSHRSNWVYQKSADNCRTFTPPVSVLLHKAQDSDPNIHDAWYAWFENGNGDTITASYVYHPCRIIGHTKERYNGYYMQMNCVDETWTNVQGNVLAMPVTKESADQETLVCDTGKERSNHGTCRMDEDGNPHLFFRQGTGQVRYFRWLGTEWQRPVTITAASKSQDGDMIVESPEVVRLLLAQSTSDGGEVCWWKTTDGGKRWHKEKCLIASPHVSYTTGALVRNAHPDGQVVVNETDSSQNHLYRKMYLLGDSGPVKRLKEEAENLGDHLKNKHTAQVALTNENKVGKRQKESGDNDE